MRISRNYENYYKEKILKIKTSEELKYFIYNLYVEDNLTYQNILTILKIRFKNSINIEKVINTIKSFDIKKCSADKLCKNYLGPFQPLNQFTDSPKTSDKKRPKCKTCQKFDNNYRKYNQKTRGLMDFIRPRVLMKKKNTLLNCIKIITLVKKLEE